MREVSEDLDVANAQGDKQKRENKKLELKVEEMTKTMETEK